MAAIKTRQLTFGPGPAGAGRTFCAAAMAAEAFEPPAFARGKTFDKAGRVRFAPCRHCGYIVRRCGGGRALALPQHERI